MADTIPGSSMLTSLQAMRAVSGDQYPRLLRIAGLERFLQPLTAENPAAAGTSDEIARLYGGIYQILGEAPTRQFFRNIGIGSAEAILNSARGQIWGQQLPDVAPAVRLGWLIEQLVAVTNATWTASELSEDTEAWYITLPQCSTCRYIQGAKAPICTANESYYGTMIRQLLGHRVLVTEVECVATGGPHCKLRIPK